VSRDRRRGRREGFGAAGAFVGGLELALYLAEFEPPPWAFVVLWGCGATLAIWAELWAGQDL
jgi:hypothetical protein